MWIVLHDQTGQRCSEFGTKKAATAAAKEMTDAHAAVDARHDGQSVSFSVLKVQEPVAEEAPVEDQ